MFLSYIFNIQSEKVHHPRLYRQFEINFELNLNNFCKNSYVTSLSSLEDLNILNQINYPNIENIFIGHKAQPFLESRNITTEEKMKLKKKTIILNRVFKAVFKTF